MMDPRVQFGDLRDTGVFVTGGGSGIGSALVEGFCRQGARVAFADFADAESRALVGRLASVTENAPHFEHVDLRDVVATKAAIASAREAVGLPFTTLVNNAARDDRHDWRDVTPERVDEIVAINLRHQLFAIQAIAPEMIEAGGGSIVNFSSTAYLLGEPDFPAYAMSKAGVIGLTRSMGTQLGPHKIRVNAVLPGWVMTERQETLWSTPEGRAKNLDDQMLKEEIAPSDLVGTVLFLASKASRMISGQSILVDAGRY